MIITKKTEQNMIMKFILIFIVLQPFFDILSNMYIDNIIPFGISTIIKPLFVFGLALYLFIRYTPNKKIWIIYLIAFIILIFGHCLILKNLCVDAATILHEIRFLVNIGYMIGLFLIFFTLFYHYEDKKELLDSLKKIVIMTFLVYCTLLLISVITNTSGMTYEYSDKLKKGFKGWYDSGQILGHAISIMFMEIIYIAFKPRKKWYIRLIIIIPIVITTMLLGTKVPYIIVILAFIIYIFISIFTLFVTNIYRRNIFNLILAFICLICMLGLYKFTPVAYNTKINMANSKVDYREYEFGNEDYYNQISNTSAQCNNKKMKPYLSWDIEANQYLKSLYASGKVHPANNRPRQFFYSAKKYSLATIDYKIFGLGFLNQDSTLVEESDFFMAIFNFGILGFICMLIIPILEFLKATRYILMNLKNIDLETYLLYGGLGVFFCISIYAGYTYIYPAFSIFLVLLITMLKCKLEINIKYKLNNKKISFLLLHLGYGGIETATINTANALSDKYEVELISFYNLDNNQVSKLNNNIKVKYLYSSGPNKEEFKKAWQDRQYFKTLKEGFKAIIILIKKKILIIKEIKKSDSKYIVSTRYDFSTLLSKYGNTSSIKIAQEHHYHNNDNRYIKILINKYKNIDYLCALTKTLETDYKDFLKNNKHTKVILLPNMLEKTIDKISDLSEKNIITVSRLTAGKKIDDIIKIFAKTNNKNWKLYIIGNGEEYNNLSKLINELNLKDKVIMTGYKSSSEMEEYFLNSSIFLMTSVTEGLPMVLLEAMNYGIPCIAYETASGVNDIIDDNRNGYVIKNRNEKQFITKLEKIMNNKKIRKEFGSKAKEKASKFSKANILKKWLKILK